MLTARITTPQIQCGITRTTPATHDIIRANVHRSPMYSGQIASRGPRYCPSIEDKIVRFGERDGHQIFLEPEDRKSTRLNSSHSQISYAVFCLKKKNDYHRYERNARGVSTPAIRRLHCRCSVHG